MVFLIVVLHEESDNFLDSCQVYHEFVLSTPIVVAQRIRLEVPIDKIFTIQFVKNS